MTYREQCGSINSPKACHENLLNALLIVEQTAIKISIFNVRGFDVENSLKNSNTCSAPSLKVKLDCYKLQDY